MKILGLVEDLTGSGHHRIHAPLTTMAAHCRVTVDVMRNPPPDVLDYDLIHVQKITQPFMAPMLRHMWTRGKPKVVLDLDDDLFNVPKDNPSYLYHANPEIRATMWEVMQHAHAITVTTEILASRVRQRTETPVTVFPNQVSERHLRNPNPEIDIMCWAGGSSHRKDLEMISKQVNQFLDSQHRTLYLIGQDYGDLFPRSYWTRWRKYEDYMRWLTFNTVGLAPLVDDEFNACRSDVKLLEYAASGALPLASICEAYNASPVAALRVGSEVWLEVLETLALEKEYLYKARLRAFESVVDRTHEKTWPARLEFYRKVVES